MNQTVTAPPRAVEVAAVAVGNLTALGSDLSEAVVTKRSLARTARTVGTGVGVVLVAIIALFPGFDDAVAANRFLIGAGRCVHDTGDAGGYSSRVTEIGAGESVHVVGVTLLTGIHGAVTTVTNVDIRKGCVAVLFQRGAGTASAQQNDQHCDYRCVFHWLCSVLVSFHNDVVAERLTLVNTNN